jgi:GrpB-like predicted nucleotidyltransferase (UPF0157 family)
MSREVTLHAYTNLWIDQFKRIKQNLQVIFGEQAIKIEHFGSTSVENMPAKPIIDVMIIVSSIDKADELVDKMCQNSYVFKGENGIPDRRYFIKYAIDGVNHIEHIHCYEENNPRIIDELMFRNYLRANKEAFEYYMIIKLEAEAKFPFDPKSYSEYKERCISDIMMKAKKHFTSVTNYNDLIDV